MNKKYIFAPKYYSKRATLTTDQIVKLNLKSAEGHSTMYYYEDIDEYMALNKQSDGSDKKIGSEAGYAGNVYADWFYLDMDKKDDLEGCIVATLPLLKYLKEKEIYHLVFFSSSKGLHIYIPKGYISYDTKLENQMYIVFKRFAKQLEKQFPSLSEVLDDQVYHKTHLIRMPFSYRESSKMRKSLLVLKDSIDKTKHFTDWFKIEPFSKDLALTIKEILFNPFPVKNPIWSLEEQVVPDRIKIKREKSKFQFPYQEKVCIYKILDDPDPSAGRHVTMLRLISFFYEKGYPEELIYQHVSYWNETLTNPMEDREIAHNMKTIGKYTYTCSDSIKLAYCSLDNSCSHWSASKFEAQILNSDQALARHIEFENAENQYFLQLDTLWPDFRAEIRPSAGHIVTWYAESG